MPTFPHIKCTKCGGRFTDPGSPLVRIVGDDVSCDASSGFLGAEVVCSVCSEKHELQIYEGKITLRPLTLTVASSGGQQAPSEYKSGGATVDSSDALPAAAYRGDLRLVQSLLAKGASVDSRDGEGRTALLRACREGRFEVVMFLLEKGANVDLPDNYRATPLIHAACSGWDSIVHVLLTHGADSRARDNTGRNALEWATFAGAKPVMELLLSGKKWWQFWK